MLLFISNGSGGTGFSEELWRRIPEEYISALDSASSIALDCPHYVHDYKYEQIVNIIVSIEPKGHTCQKSQNGLVQPGVA